MVNASIIAIKNNSNSTLNGSAAKSKAQARISLGDVLVNGKMLFNLEYSFEKTDKTDYKGGKLPLDINAPHVDVYVNVEVAYPGAKMVSAHGVDAPAKTAPDEVFSEKFAIGNDVVFLRPQDKASMESAREAILEQTAEIILQKEFKPVPKPVPKKISDVEFEFSGHYLG